MENHTVSTRKTPLNAAHKRLGAKMLPFSGWEMPISYEGVLAEHATVRNACGIFDVSHMGEIRVAGPDAESFLLNLAMNDASKLRPGQGQYSGFLLPSGGMIDDLIVYRLEKDDFIICVNASNADKDFAWVQEHTAGFSVRVTNQSSEWAQIAIQGPNALAATRPIINDFSKNTLASLPYMAVTPAEIFGKAALIARTGYTGEKGFEIYLDPSVAERAWDRALSTTSETGIRPIGLGARDTLRLEACYLLYGNDIDESTTPLEAGIPWAVKLDRGPFCGRDALLRQKQHGIPRKIVAFRMVDSAIARPGMDVFLDSTKIGKVTSGSALPTLGGAGGMMLLMASDHINIGAKLEVDIRGKRKLAEIVARPLYSARAK